MSKVKILESLLFAGKGFIRTSDVVNAGVSKTYFGEFVRKNDLERIAHGLYAARDSWDDGMYVIQVRYPDAVFSHETALYLLNLSEREPDRYSVTVKSGTNSTGLNRNGIKVYKVNGERFTEGIIEVLSSAGRYLRAYNPERTICDLLRYRRHIEAQELQSAIKEYMRLREKNIPLLMRYAKVFSVEKILRTYLEVLL